MWVIHSNLTALQRLLQPLEEVEHFRSRAQEKVCEDFPYGPPFSINNLQSQYNNNDYFGNSTINLPFRQLTGSDGVWQFNGSVFRKVQRIVNYCLLDL